MFFVMLANWILAIPAIFAFKQKIHSHVEQSDLVYGQCVPAGPLSKQFYAKMRLPGFPFEFPPIIPGSHDRYLIFPPPDSQADYEASSRRCATYNGKLVDILNPTEMKILACALSGPSFIGGWTEMPVSEECMVLQPEGLISISADNCNLVLGSICKVPGGMILDGFQLST